MKKLFSRSAPLFITLLGFATTANAGGLILGTPTSNGSGCPSGSVGAVVSPDGEELSILFDRYVGEVGGSTGRRTERKNCILSIPVQVPAGMSASLVQVDYRGFHEIPSRATMTLMINYSMGNAHGPRYVRRFVGALSGDFLTTNKLRANDVKWTACGASATLRIDSELIVSTNGPQEYATAGLDSADLRGAVTYEVRYRSCP